MAGFSLTIGALVGAGSKKASRTKQRRNDVAKDSLVAAGHAGNMDARIQKVRYDSRRLATHDDKSRRPVGLEASHKLWDKFKPALQAYKKTDTDGFENAIAVVEREIPPAARKLW